MKETSLLKNASERNVDDQQSLSQRSIPIYKKDINGYTVVHNISSSPSHKHSNSRTCPSSAINRSHMKKTISNLYFSNIATIKHVPLDLHVNNKLIHKSNNNKSTITTTPPTPNNIIKNKSAACLINKCFSISRSINDKHKSFEDKASLTSRTSLFKHNISMNNSNSNINSNNHSLKQQRNSLLPSLQVFQLGSTHLKRATTTSKLFNNMVVVNKVKEHKPKRIRLITNIKQQQQQQQQHQRNNIKVHSICFNKEQHSNKKDSVIEALLPNDRNVHNNNNTNIKLKFPIKLNKTKINHKPRSLKEKYIQFINARCELNKKVFPLNEASTFDAIKNIRRKQYNPLNI